MLAFDLAKEILKFMETRTEARELYHATVARLKPMAGSEFYRKELKAAREKRTATVEAAQVAARTTTRELFAQMRQNAARIHSDPPTPEMLAILQALQMRESITAAELEDAAAAMSGNSVALAVIDDLSRKNGRITNYASAVSGNSRQAVEGIIAELERETAKILDDPVGVAPAALLYARQQKMMFNRDLAADDLPRVKTYSDEFELLQDLGVGDFDKFTEAVG